MTKRVLVLAVLLLVSMLVCQQANAQSEQVRFKQLGIDQGLTHPEIRAILKDSRGFIWVGTAFGLNRFDGYTVKSFHHDARDTTSLLSDEIFRLFEAPDGLLVVQTSRGFTLYNPERENFEHNLGAFFSKYGTSAELTNIMRHKDGSFWFIEPTKLVRYDSKLKKSLLIQHHPNDSSAIISDDISSVALDRNGNQWLVHKNGIVEKIRITPKGARVVKRVMNMYQLNTTVRADYKITCDRDGGIWLCAPFLNRGLYYYDPYTEEFLHFNTDSQRLKLSANDVTSVTEATNGAIWIGTDHGGITILDKATWTVRYASHREGDEKSVAENSVTAIYKDDQGIMWIGTYKQGVSFYHENIYRFALYRRYALDEKSLPFEDVNEFAEDSRGNLWIGTNGGGLLYFDRATGKFTQYLNEPGNENSLSANVIVALCMDSQHNLWIGTYKGGLNKFDGKKFTRYLPVKGDSLSVPSLNVWEVFEDSRKRLWIGTIESGAALFDRKSGKCHRVRIWGPNAMQSPTADVINEDRHGNIWFGTMNGIDVLSEDDKTFTHYSASSEPNSLSHNTVLDIFRDSRGQLWVATFDGLNLFDEEIDGFRVFRDNGNRDAVLTVQEDSDGHIWMSTLDGLIEMTLNDSSYDQAIFKRYTKSDGIQGRQFNQNAGFKTRQGELVFGGPTGFNILNARQRKPDVLPTRVIFSALQLYEKTVGIGEVIDGVVVLNKSISEATEITLPPNKNFFSINVSAQNYFNPERDRYMYKLEGLSDEWLPIDAKSNKIVFNSLRPGRYKLRVNVLTNDGAWGKKEAVLFVVIRPPFWKTNTAFLLYALTLIIILLIARNLIQQREKLKYALEQERREIQRVQEMDVMKVKFFTNVSHEFRTPLTLILTPIERLVKKVTDPDMLVQFQLIQRNCRRLMTLVNQLLDFKKLEVHDIKFNPVNGDIVNFIRDTALSFSDLSEKKNIKLEFHSSVDHLNILFDEDKLEKILFNLLSNAFKFTLENGVVSVNLEVIKHGDEQLVKIDVKDTGIGIPQDKIDKIFEPFFQTELPKSVVNVGSGIGLSITKEFVRIHGGMIKVESEEGKGSCFSVTIPLVQPINAARDVVPNDAPTAAVNDKPLVQSESDKKHNVKAKKHSLLIVEDNDDFRFYLKDNLKFSYTVYEARNGVEGWDLVISQNPDLIVSDIMMPQMDGIDLCSKIKSDERVSHVPVILLTARSSEEQRLEGFKAGADDYITKPFNFEVLEARVNNLLRRREKSQKTFRKTLAVKSSELQITPLDVTFIEKAVKIVEKHVSSSSFSVEDLGDELGISRAYVFRKILALTGKTPLEFIRTIRMQHAAQLLEKSQLSVREVAYKVGFNNTKYFTKYFKEEFKVVPSEYAETKRKGAESNNQE